MILLYHKHWLFARHFEESRRDVDRRPLGQVKSIRVIVGLSTSVPPDVNGPAQLNHSTSSVWVLGMDHSISYLEIHSV